MKKLLSIFLIFVMLLSFAACGQEAESKPEPENKPEPSKKNYVIRENNTSVIPVEYETNSDGYINKQYFQLNGLKDEELQRTINAELKETFLKSLDWSTLPPYRGIAIEAKKWEGMEPESSYSMEDCYFSCGNVMSAVVNSQISYSRYDDNGYYESFYVADNQCLNYDLTTGNKLKIADVFMDGVDGIKYINDQIIKAIQDTSSIDEGWYFGDGWGSFKLVGDFPGISEDQKFYLSMFGDEINLVFDYETPWVQTNGYDPLFFTIDISDVTGVGTKFNKDDIYVNDEVVYALKYNSFDPLEQVHDIDTSKYEGINNFFIEKSIGYYSSMPDYQVEYMRRFVEEYTPRIDSFIEDYVNPNQFDNRFTGWATLTSHANRIGPYTNIGLNLYLDASSYDEYDNYLPIYNESCQEYVVYKEGIEEPLKLSDIFVPGYDFSKLGLSPDETSFEIEAQALFIFSGDEFRNISYQEIGCENLTIFE